MSHKLVTMLGWAGLCLMFGTLGCSTPDDFSYSEADATTNAVDAPVLTTSANLATASPDTLRPGDRIEIAFSGNSTAPVYPHREQVRENGEIEPPLLGRAVMAAGKTIGQFQNELHDLYVPAYFRTLTVTVRLEDRYFFVGGQVRMPGQKLYLSEMTVTKAIQAAGDFTDFANRRKVEVIRKNGTREIVDFRKALRNANADLPVFPGDMIHVGRRW